MTRKKPKGKILKKEKRIVKYKNKDGKWIEQIVEVKIYESIKAPKDTSLAEEILNNIQSNKD
jgi:hypothetical protein